VTDLCIEPGGDMRNSVSPGLASDRVRAKTRAGDVRRLACSPRIQDRHRSASVYWMDFALAANEEVVPGDFQTRPNRIIRLESRDCTLADAAGFAP
jgi:hypothetical protein